MNVRGNQVIKLVTLRRFTKQFGSTHHVSKNDLEISVARAPIVHLVELVRLQDLLENN